MKSLFAFAALLVVTASLTSGCKKEAAIEKTETVTTPGGETTVTEKTEVEKTGDHK
jgi:hypothetical protein